ERDLVRRGVDLEQRSAFPDELALLVELLEEDPRDAGADLDFLGALHLPDRFEDDGHVLRLRFPNPGRDRLGGGRGGGLRGAVAAVARGQRGGEDQRRRGANGCRNLVHGPLGPGCGPGCLSAIVYTNTRECMLTTCAEPKKNPSRPDARSSPRPAGRSPARA